MVLIYLLVHMFFYFYLVYNFLIFILLNIFLLLCSLLNQYVNECNVNPTNLFLKPFVWFKEGKKRFSKVTTCSSNSFGLNLSKNKYVTYIYNEYDELTTLIFALILSKVKAFTIAVVLEQMNNPFKNLNVVMGNKTNSNRVIDLHDDSDDDIPNNNSIKID